MEYIEAASIERLIKNGVTSEQLLFPENSNSERVTITRVTVDPGGEQPRHTHASSEQVWIALSGKGFLLLDNNIEREFPAGDVVRFEDKDVHGLANKSDSPFVYMSVTSPPLNFRKAYRNER